jgi:hypothetical protein
VLLIPPCVNLGRIAHGNLIGTAESVELTRSEILGDRRLRMANSSPDVKALFNAPAYIYDLEEHEDSQSAYGPPGTGHDYWTPLPPIVSPLSPNLGPINDSHAGHGDCGTTTKYRGCTQTRVGLTTRVEN